MTIVSSPKRKMVIFDAGESFPQNEFVTCDDSMEGNAAWCHAQVKLHVVYSLWFNVPLVLDGSQPHFSQTKRT